MSESELPVIKPVERSTLSQQVREQLTDWIVSGELAPGQAMPSERMLSEQFGVARTSIREAIQGLRSIGLVERRGNRSYITEHLPGITMDGQQSTNFVRELFETRRVLELPILELAAMRATDRQRSHILELAEAFAQPLDIATFRTLDQQFHAATAAACGNPLLVEVYGKVLDALFTSPDFAELLTASSNTAPVGVIVQKAGHDHAAIATAIAQGNAVQTLAAAELHLASIETMLQELL